MNYFLNLDKFWKQTIVLLSEIFLCTLSILFAYYLRLESLPLFSDNYLKVFFISYLIFIPSFIFYGLYSSFFRYSGTHTIFQILYALSTYMIIFAGVLFFLNLESVPRSISIIQPMIFFLLVSFNRRFISYLLNKSSYNPRKIKLAIFGAGLNTFKYMSYFGDYKIEFLFDNDPKKIGRKINGHKILNSNLLKKKLQEKEIKSLFFTNSLSEYNDLKSTFDEIRDLNILVRFLPKFSDFFSNYSAISEINKINFDDLISNKISINENSELISDLKNKNILITGAGGSIGSELCRQLCNFDISSIVLYENNEFNLYSINKELNNFNKDNIKIIPILGSVTELNKLNLSLFDFKIDYIFHAAAYKHVPLIEEKNNVVEAAKNNIIGTLNIIEFAIKNNCKKVLLISTDKAVRPTNNMGASKRIAENLFQSFAESHNTIFSIVRFGNVVNSKGSALPLFNDQIQNKMPVTITHPEIKRYFMTIPDAAKLILVSNFLSTHSSKCKIYFLDMGKPIKILDLVKKMINLSGLSIKNDENKNGDIEIEFIGLRPGEKLNEELVIGSDFVRSSNKNILFCNENYIKKNEMIEICNLVKKAIELNDYNIIYDIYNKHVEGFEKKI